LKRFLAVIATVLVPAIAMAGWSFFNGTWVNTDGRTFYGAYPTAVNTWTPTPTYTASPTLTPTFTPSPNPTIQILASFSSTGALQSSGVSLGHDSDNGALLYGTNSNSPNGIGFGSFGTANSGFFTGGSNITEWNQGLGGATLKFHPYGGYLDSIWDATGNVSFNDLTHSGGTTFGFTTMTITFGLTPTPGASEDVTISGGVTLHFYHGLYKGHN